MEQMDVVVNQLSPPQLGATSHIGDQPREAVLSQCFSSACLQVNVDVEIQHQFSEARATSISVSKFKLKFLRATYLMWLDLNKALYAYKSSRLLLAD